MMEYINQVKDVQIVINTTPRVYVSWNNTEHGRDKTECYERIDNAGSVIYVNTNNRNQSAITKGQIFYDILEYLYNQASTK